MNPEFMHEAIRLAADSMRANQGGPFGAVVVRDGEIVGRGSNQVLAQNDPTAHAEIVAIRDACRTLRTFRLDECEIYTSCEPCPMCLAAIYWARVKKGYYGATRQDAAAIGFDDDHIYSEIAQPPGERLIILEPCLREKAIEAFEEWKNKPDKIEY